VAHTHKNESYQTWWNLIIDFLGFYKKIKSLRKRSAAIGPFGSALPPHAKSFWPQNGRQNLQASKYKALRVAQACKPVSIRLCG
jgi:hypothetical protein